MKKLLANYRAYAEQHARYRQTRDEIAGLSKAESIDLGIFPCDAEKIARKAVWG